MLELARPGVLIAGALLALVPVLLHFITRRPPERAPLPTARFLRPQPRTAIHVERRPADLLLLLLRTSFVLLVACAFAAPSWSAPRRGTIDFVLLDRGRGMAGAWPAAVDSARRLINSATAQLIVFDTVAAPATLFSGDDVALDSLRAAGTAPVESDYAVGLRALLERATSSRADSARVWLITRPRWGAWSAGFAHVREAAWPGAIEIVSPNISERVAAPAQSARSAAGRAQVLARADTFARAALEAIGYRVLNGDSAAADVLLVDAALIDSASPNVIATARAGATVMIAGPPPPSAPAEAWPWRRNVDSVAASAPVTFDDGTELVTLENAVSGDPEPGARVIAAGSNGRVAAVAQPHGSGCIVHFAGDLFLRQTALSDGYVPALRRLARGCAPPGTRAIRDGTEMLPLDSAARALLQGDMGMSERRSGDRRMVQRAIPLSRLGSAGGRSLMRPLLIGALLVALAETWLAHRGGART